jgi:hypothetical protein
MVLEEKGATRRPHPGLPLRGEGPRSPLLSGEGQGEVKEIHIQKTPDMCYRLLHSRTNVTTD